MRQYLWLLEEQNVLEYLVLAGDHLYRMDYQRFIKCHRENNADITIAALPMDEKRATAFGLMKIDDTGRIIEFAEKPKGEALKKLQVRQGDINSMMLIAASCILSWRMFNRRRLTLRQCQAFRIIHLSVIC